MIRRRRHSHESNGVFCGGQIPPQRNSYSKCVFDKKFIVVGNINRQTDKDTIISHVSYCGGGPGVRHAKEINQNGVYHIY